MATMDVKVIISAIDNASGVIKGVGDKLQATGEKMATVGKSMMRSITLPIVGIGVAAMKTTADFDTQMRAANQMMKVNAQAFGTMKTDIQKLAVTTGRTTTEMADSLYNVASAGFRGEEAFKVLQVVGEAATAGLADASAVTGTLTKALNIFGYSGDQARDTMDKMFRIVDAGLLTFEELSGSFPRAATQAGALGVSMEEVGAALATVTKTAGSTEEAATAINGVMTGLIKPTEELSALVGQWGYENVQAAIKSEGFTGILGRLKEEAGGNAERMGELFANTRALKALFPLIGESADDYTNALITLGDETITTSKYFKEMAEGPGFKMKQAWISLTVAGQKFGDVIAPAVERVAAGISKLTEWFGNLSPKTQGFIAIAMAFLAILGPILFIVGHLISAIGALGVAIGAFGIALGVIFSPLGVAIALYGALIWAGKRLIDNWDTVKENASTAWGAIKAVIIAFITPIKDAFVAFGNIVSGVWERITSNLVVMGDAIKSVFNTIAQFLTGVIVVLAGITRPIWEPIVEATVMLVDFLLLRWTELKDKLTELVLNLSNAILNVWGKIKTGIQSVMIAITDFLGTKATEAKNAIMIPFKALEKAWEETWDFLGKATEKAWEIIQVPINKIISLFTRVKDAISNAFSAVGGFFKNVGSTIGSSISNLVTIGNSGLNFDKGGIVPGPIGVPVPAIVHGGETVIPQGRTLGNFNITITGNTFMSDEDAALKIGNMIISELKLGNRL